MNSHSNRFSHAAVRLLTLFLVLILAAPASAQYSEHKLTASDASSMESFGGAVSLSGDRALVGAVGSSFQDEHGSAYIFERQEDGSWEEVAKLTASDGAPEDIFGRSVSLCSDRALVGAHLDDNANGTDSGAVYVFERREDGNWEEVAKLIASDGQSFENLGDSVSLSCVASHSGDHARALIGRNRGLPPSAYLYEREADGSWEEVAKFTHPGDDDGSGFGYSVSLEGDRALIGAQYDDNLVGSAYVFERQPDGSWEEVAKLVSNGNGGEFLGAAVSLSGDRALLGAYRDVIGGNMGGSAHVYDRREDGSWEEVAMFIIPDGNGHPHDSFGSSLSLSGDRALVAALGRGIQGVGDNLGFVYVYERQDDGSWALVATVTASDRAEGDAFGISVSLTSDYALVGASGNDDDGIGSGSAYIYDVSPSVLVELTPDSDPVTIPPEGGSFDFTLALTNTASEDVSHDLWISAVGSNSFGYTIFGPVAITIPAGGTLSRMFVQHVPAGPELSVMISAQVGTFDTDVVAGDAFQMIREGAAVGRGGQDLWPLAEADARGWVVTTADEVGGETISAVEMPAAPMEEVPIGLGAGYPNPFNPQTNLSYNVEAAGHVSIVVYNAIGQEVAVLVDGRLEPGRYQATFDAHELPSGVYFVRMASGGFADTQRVTLMK